MGHYRKLHEGMRSIVIPHEDIWGITECRMKTCEALEYYMKTCVALECRAETCRALYDAGLSHVGR